MTCHVSSLQYTILSDENFDSLTLLANISLMLARHALGMMGNSRYENHFIFKYAKE